MFQYLLLLAYKGTTYHGLLVDKPMQQQLCWHACHGQMRDVGFQAQLQNHAGQEPREFRTVQAVLEKSLKRVRNMASPSKSNTDTDTLHEAT